MPTTSPSSQAVSRAASAVERARRRGAGTSSSEHDVDHAVGVLHQQPTIAAVPPGGGAAVAVAVEDASSPCGPRWKSRSFQPIVVGSSAGSSAAHGPGSATGSRSSGSTQPVAPPSSDDLDGADVGQRLAHRALVAPSHQTRSASVPGPKVAQPAPRPARRTPRRPPAAAGTLAQPLLASASTAGARSSSAPSLRAADDRPLDGRAGSSTRGAIGDVGAVRLAGREVEPARRASGSSLAQLVRRSSAAPSREPGRARARRCAVEPGGAVRRRCPAASTSLASRAAAAAGDPGRGAPPDGRQQVAREDEDGAPHRELLDQRAVVVERAVDVGDG